MQRKRGLELGRPFGAPLLVHRSWFPAGSLLAAHLSITVFGPEALPIAITLGVVTSMLIFGSVLLHELAHLAARRLAGIRTIDVTLFLFGGVARTSETRRDIAGAGTALTGPAVSGAVGVMLLSVSSSVPAQVGELLRTLGLANLVLAGMNLLPFAPLDGERLLTAIASIVSDKRDAAARFALRGGQIVGAASVGIGVWIVVVGFNDTQDAAAGLWLALIGAFVVSEATRMSRARTVAAQVEGATAGSWARPFTGRVRAETEVPVSGGPYAVSDGSRLAGILIPRSMKANRGKRASEAMIPWTPNIGLPADSPLPDALERLAASRAGALVVLDERGVVRGVLDADTVRARLGAD